MYDIARLAKKAGLKTVMVTNGFINQKPLDALLEYIDAFSVDLKAFKEDFYTKVTSGSLEAVKETLLQIHKSGKHLEVVNLIVPNLNDDDTSFSAMIHWMATELGIDTVLHISRYFPNFKLTTEATSISSMRRLKQIAEGELTYVYSGNIPGESNDTYCTTCGNILIKRYLYNVIKDSLDADGKCRVCDHYFHKKT